MSHFYRVITGLFLGGWEGIKSPSAPIYSIYPAGL